MTRFGFCRQPRPMAETVAADLTNVGVTLQLDDQQYASGTGKWRAKELPAFFSNWGSYGKGLPYGLLTILADILNAA